MCAKYHENWTETVGVAIWKVWRQTDRQTSVTYTINSARSSWATREDKNILMALICLFSLSEHISFIWVTEGSDQDWSDLSDSLLQRDVQYIIIAIIITIITIIPHFCGVLSIGNWKQTTLTYVKQANSKSKQCSARNSTDYWQPAEAQWAVDIIWIKGT